MYVVLRTGRKPRAMAGTFQVLPGNSFIRRSTPPKLC